MTQVGVSRVTMNSNNDEALSSLKQEVQQLQQLVSQLQNGSIAVQHTTNEPAQKRMRPRNNEFQIQTGRIHEIMKRATRSDLRKI